jgi:hypothetical protein
MDSDSAASEYRLDIKGISVFCPCGEFLWLYDDGSRFKLSRHLKKCKKYKNKQGLPLTNIVNQSLMAINVEKEDFICTNDTFFFCENTKCRFSKFPFGDKRSSSRHQQKCGSGILAEHAYYHKDHKDGLVSDKFLLSMSCSVSNSIYCVDQQEEKVISSALPKRHDISTYMINDGQEVLYNDLVVKYLTEFENIHDFDIKIKKAINSVGNYSNLVNNFFSELLHQLALIPNPCPFSVRLPPDFNPDYLV